MRIMPIGCGFFVTLLLSACLSNARAEFVTFGSGANAFGIDFVTIGDPGNAADTTGSPNPVGSVGYKYGISKFEISREMVTKANAAGGLGIAMHSMSFVSGGARALMPATGISWFEAAQFTNYLNTSSGFQQAYKFDSFGAFQLWQAGDVGFDATNPYRNSLANFVLPSVDEWYKAAYYDPIRARYFNYPTGSDTVPVAVSSGTGAGTAVYATASGPADIDLAGGLSPYGVMGLGGNVWEWEETSFDRLNNSTSSVRAVRGGAWYNGSSSLSSSDRLGSLPFGEFEYFGFRVASLNVDVNVVPEPTSLVLWGLACVGGLLIRRRQQAK